MGLVITGRGTSGSWQIRGVQMARALGVDAVPNLRSPHKYTAAVVVKRLPQSLLDQLHAARIPIIYDIVDAWPQPEGNNWDGTRARVWLGAHLQQVRPAAVVAATRAMAKDCESLGYKAFTVPHHANPEIGINPIRQNVEVVGYQGGAEYLGKWHEFLVVECAKRGWRFVVNPPYYTYMDIVVALRESTGYPAVKWKSNVKLANAQGSGTPCILVPEMGYLETQCGAELIISTESGLRLALDMLADRQQRAERSAKLLAAAPRLPVVAAMYKEWLQCTLGMRF